MWDYQRAAARRIAERTNGVYGVQNRIVLKPRASAVDVARHITDALARNAALDAKKIDVRSSGNTVTLDGTVRSWAELTQAVRATWASPNVTEVHNHLVVKPY
jgi:osmotically-inducible protein OsmY